jgi:3,4-dihydroxy 2-butanone 4-phosphate synthase/GTP cyclohydrolase II
MVMGQFSAQDEIPVRVHEPLSVLDLLEVDRGRHAWSVPRALQAIAEHGAGVLVMLNCTQDAQALRRQFDVLAGTAPLESRLRGKGKMDLRSYGVGAQILRDLGVGRMRVLSQPRRIPSMAGYDLQVVGYESQP